jgi:hypothetical protein
MPELQKYNSQTPTGKSDASKNSSVAIKEQATIFYNLC